MKKRNLVLGGAVAAVMIMSMACSGNSSSTSSADSSVASTVAANANESSKAPESEAVKVDSKETTKAEEKKETTKEITKEANMKESTIKGKISDIRDMQFTITDEKGIPYLLTFDKKPEGLDKVADGDSVEVTYTGELNEVDAFTGTVVSVKKVK